MRLFRGRRKKRGVENSLLGNLFGLDKQKRERENQRSQSFSRDLQGFFRALLNKDSDKNENKEE